MALRKWERPLSRPAWPEDRFDRLIRDVFGGVMRKTGKWPMQVEEYVEDGHCVVRLEMPGLDPDTDIDVEIGGGAVHVAAQREERTQEERPEAYRSEFRYGSFERSIPLPDGATEKDVSATYRDGILEVRLPLASTGQEPTTTRVEVVHS